MAEYIKKEDIGLTDFDIVMCKGDYKEALKMLIDKIENAPVADVVEVVRCKDCIHYDGRLCHNPNTFDDEKTAGNTTDMWYCADGEKKNG